MRVRLLALVAVTSGVFLLTKAPLLLGGLSSCPAPCPSPYSSPSSAVTGQEALLQLRRLRFALLKYYAATEGLYPDDLTKLVPTHIASLPPCVTPWHSSQAGVKNYTTSVMTNGRIDPAKITDTGRWGYVSDRKLTGEWGQVFIDCKHLDSSDYETSTTLENLKTIRAALTRYYGDTGGLYPSSLSALVPKYLRYLPSCVTCSFGTVSGEIAYDKWPILTTEVKNVGKWGYVNNKTSLDWGRVFISATESTANYMDFIDEPAFKR